MSTNRPPVPRRTVIVDQNGNITPINTGSGPLAGAPGNPGAQPATNHQQAAPGHPPGPAFTPPTYIRPWKEELLIRLATSAGYALGWPVRMAGMLAEQLMRSLASIIRVVMMLLLVPALLLFAAKFAVAQSSAEPRTIGRNAALALTQTIGGIGEGVKAAIDALTGGEEPAPGTESNANKQPDGSRRR